MDLVRAAADAAPAPATDIDVHVIGAAGWWPAARFGLPEFPVLVDSYPDGEPRIRLSLGSSRRAIVVTHMVDESGGFDAGALITALGAVVALRQHGYAWVGLMTPEVPAARQDRPTEGIAELSAAELVGRLVAGSGVDCLVAWDLKRTWHAPNVATHQPSERDRAAAIASAWDDAARRWGVPQTPSLVVAPDHGARGLATAVAERLGAPVRVLDKRRHATEHVVVSSSAGPVTRQPDDAYLVIDDMVVSAGTLCAAVETLGLHGDVWAYASHFRPTATGVARLSAIHETGRLRGVLVPDFTRPAQPPDGLLRADVASGELMSKCVRLAAS